MAKRFEMNRRQLMTGTALLTAGIPALKVAAKFADPAPDLTGTSILITGCSSGFGRLGAEHYARLGAKVFATMRNLPRPEADELRTVAERDNLDIEIIDIDVLSDTSVSAGVEKALASTGGTLDVLINNAGIGITGPVEVQDMEATKLAFDTNVFGAQRMIRAALPAMRAAGKGQIFSISSQLGRVIIPGAGHYSATKFALEALNEQLAYELVPHGIDVTLIQPGGYPTQIWVKRNRYNTDLKNRASKERLAAYPQMAASMGRDDGNNSPHDPMDIPHAIVEIISMPAGSRPLRRAVHPAYRPQEAINAVSAKTQLEFLGKSAYGPWIKAVLG
jgi:NAD(P)-dependent dehydrogenase (short-subunit alcohol dehydrogenase family)